MNENENVYLQSNIYVENREKIRVSGVQDVDNFSEESISVKTQKGDLMIGGEGLKITKLDVESGELLIDGSLHSLFYNDNALQKTTSFFGRLMK